MRPIETSAELYREMKKRGLHLKPGDGRDDALLRELAASIGCPDLKLQEYLDKSNISAEDFLKSFLRLAQPFAQMFEEIWQYLARKCAPGAKETISIRFGFPKAGQHTEFDLETFRRHVESANEVMAMVDVTLWPSEALMALFQLGRILLPHQAYGAYDKYRRHYYVPGKPYALPEISSHFHEFDGCLVRIREVFQKIIDGYVREMKKSSARTLPEIRDRYPEEGETKSLKPQAYLLTDLLPMWYRIFDGAEHIGSALKDEAMCYYRDKIEHILIHTTRRGYVHILKALDILDLPFWHHRWHTYEIWATILILGVLDKYKPTPRIVDRRIPLDGFTAEVIAHLAAQDFPNACVAVQVQTEFKGGSRKAIKPDLRICFSDDFVPSETAAVVEFKQRARLNPSDIREIATSYRDGSPRSGGVIIINYDVTGLSIQMPQQCFFLEGVRPGNNAQIQELNDNLLRLLKVAGLIPKLGSIAVLLDVSGSMGRAYESDSVQDALRKLLDIPWINILRFNNGLLPGGDLDEATCKSIKTSGGTELGRALYDMEQLIGLPDRLLVVTDGEHDHPMQKLERISEVRECKPVELSDAIDWLTS